MVCGVWFFLVSVWNVDCGLWFFSGVLAGMWIVDCVFFWGLGLGCGTKTRSEVSAGMGDNGAEGVFQDESEVCWRHL